MCYIIDVLHKRQYYIYYNYIRSKAEAMRRCTLASRKLSIQLWSKFTGQLSLAIPPWVGAMSTGHVMRLGIKAGMARVWWQAKLIES